MEDKKCVYCGKEAFFQLKNSNWCCSKSWTKCPELKRRNSEGVKKAHKDGKIPGWGKLWKSGQNFSWNKGRTKETDNRIAKAAKKKSLTSKGKPGHVCSKETKQLLSSKMQGTNNGHVKTKYYEIFCPYLNKNIKVQGTWELAYAKYLNENNIKWTRDRKLNIKYKLHDDDYIHTYYPDFYLPDTNEYIEVKGYMWKSKDGRVDDKRKIEKIKECNPDKKITVLMKEDLKLLNVL